MAITIGESRLPHPPRHRGGAVPPREAGQEQGPREARERHEPEIRPPKYEITDSDELSEYRLRERKRFEGLVRRTGTSVSQFERALDVVAHRSHTVCVKYAQFEMRTPSVSHARNAWDRAVSLLPRVDQLWYKYAHMEELLGTVGNARQVFERWMAWRPGAAGWNAYIKFETQHSEIERDRAIYERLVAEHPLPDTFIRYANFETKHGAASGKC